jgi:hypothetical protein
MVIATRRNVLCRIRLFQPTCRPLTNECLAASGGAAGLNPLYQDFYYGKKPKQKHKKCFPKASYEYQLRLKAK